MEPNGGDFCVQEFLEKGVYKSSEAARKEGAKKESRMTITRTIGRTKPLPYEVTDKTPEQKQEWERVVAVFVTGATWQFKGFPDPVPPPSPLLPACRHQSGAKDGNAKDHSVPLVLLMSRS